MKIHKLFYRSQLLLTLCFVSGVLTVMSDAAVAQEDKAKTAPGVSAADIAKLTVGAYSGFTGP